ncbi:hypothetical protein GOP47_0015032 [Adiantum capillus-veneris]|uniref:Uncharacterized protein n=1 Tax=Adiantum capillus-veneris TaxID=13818 RepID=A0A9D4ZD05_ADICA|nr:hypothetical protein GOP47_0015032 [Adiantum capillus-veneris]
MVCSGQALPDNYIHQASRHGMMVSASISLLQTQSRCLLLLQSSRARHQGLPKQGRHQVDAPAPSSQDPPQAPKPPPVSAPYGKQKNRATPSRKCWRQRNICMYEGVYQVQNLRVSFYQEKLTSGEISPELVPIVPEECSSAAV